MIVDGLMSGTIWLGGRSMGNFVSRKLHPYEYWFAVLFNTAILVLMMFRKETWLLIKKLKGKYLQR
jgi:hypothetical protein